MSRRWILSILVLYGLFSSLPLGMQTEGLPATWVVERAEALELASSASPTDRSLTAPHVGHEQAAPQKARDLLTRLQARHGESLPGYVGGRAFQNRERRLPSGHYREHDVNPKIRHRPRDSERVIIEQDTGRAYYTSNHYRTFMPLNEIP